jgi:membrane protein implicated in regulation of membrane protease activity
VLQDAISIAIAAVGAVLVALSIRRARSKGAAAALQQAAVGFLLMGASAIGIVGFLAGIALSPLAWLGIVSLALAGVLFVVGQRLEGRQPTRRAATTGRPTKGEVTAKAPAAEDDFSDIEAILKKHGIS